MLLALLNHVVLAALDERRKAGIFIDLHTGLLHLVDDVE